MEDQLREGLRVVLACPPIDGLADSAARAGIPVVPWPASRDPGAETVAETLRLARIVRRTRPDVIHLHSSKAGLAGRLAVRGGVPTVFQPHGWSFEAVSGRRRSVVVAWERFATRWVEALLCVSEGERARGVEVGIDGRWAVVATGIDLTEFPRADDASRAAARTALGLGEGPIVICVGRLSHAKGQDVLLDAWPLVRKEIPDARVVLVGDGDNRRALERRAVEGVVFAGDQPNVAAWLAAADLAAQPSRWEGMSLGLLEAMASARSVVATDVPGVREALGDSSSAIVPVEGRRELADAIIKRLLDADLAAIEGDANRLRAEESYERSRVTRAIDELYETIARGRAGGRASTASARP